MKKTIITILVLAATVASAEMKVGTIDLMKLVRNHPNYESNKTYLADKDKDYQQRIESIKKEGEELQATGRRKAEEYRNPMLNDKSKAELEKQLTDIQQKLVTIEQKYRSEAARCRQELQDDEARLLKTTTEDLRKRITKFAEANGYDFVLDKSAAPYAKAAFDVTDEILKGMGVDPSEAKGVEDKGGEKKDAAK